MSSNKSPKNRPEQPDRDVVLISVAPDPATVIGDPKKMFLHRYAKKLGISPGQPMIVTITSDIQKADRLRSEGWDVFRL